MKTPLIGSLMDLPSSPPVPTTQDDPPEATVIVDKTLGTRYRRGKLLGKGGFAKVYEIVKLDSGAKFADKVIHKDVFQKKKSSKEKVRKEIELHKDLSHRNIVRLLSFFEDADFIHIILEYCSLKSLLHLMKSRRVLTEAEVRNFMAQICSGVRYIHGRGIIHRDLKLGNMFLTGAHCVKIGDFGLATTLSTHTLPAATVTTLCGTPNYIAPEVLRKQGHSRETDVWALGCMTYAMLAGSPPFETKSLSATYAKITANDYDIAEGYSPEVTGLIRKMLHPEAQFRGHLHVPGHPDDLLEHPFFKMGQDEAVLQRQQQHMQYQQQQQQMYQQQQQVLQAPRAIKGTSGRVRVASSMERGILEATEDLIKHLQKLLNIFLETSSIGVTLPQYASALPRPSPPLPVHVSKWIDYSNKYGFGYQLSDKSIGVLFNDGKKIGTGPSRIEQIVTDDSGRMSRFATGAVPQQFQHHVKLLQYFAQYMDENLADNSKSSSDKRMVEAEKQLLTQIASPTTASATQVVAWFRTRACVIMVLDNLSIQINFFSDHEKVILWRSSNNNNNNNNNRNNNKQQSFGGTFVTLLSGDAPLTLPISILTAAPAPALTTPHVTQKVRDCLTVLSQYRVEGIVKENKNEQ